MRAVLDVVCRPQETQHELVWAAGERNLIFYAKWQNSGAGSRVGPGHTVGEGGNVL